MAVTEAMTDKDLQKLMDKTADACINHTKLLKQLEEVYKERFGAYPADVDDDWFIDSFCYAGGRTTLQKLTENALMHKQDG